MIATDGNDVEPQTYDTIVTNAGERYDFILDANHKSGDFWIRIRGLGVCQSKEIDTVALLRYGSNVSTPLPVMPNYDDEYPLGKVIRNKIGLVKYKYHINVEKNV